MGSFQAKIGWKRMRKRENKNCHSVPTPRVIENSKKQQKIFKKLRNTTMASFQPEIGWKMPRKREYKKYRSVLFLPDGKQKIPKNSKF